MRRMIRKAIYFLKNYFLPTQANNNFPYALRIENLSLVILLALIIKSLSFASWLVLPKLPFFADISSGLIVQLTNEQRQLAGLSPVSQSPVLSQVAQDKAQDMVSKGYFSHNSPDGLSPWHWFAENNYSYQYAGENLAIDFFESKDVVDAWMNSPTHRFNLLNQNYQEIGVAVVSGQIQEHQTTLVVQVFGTPKTKLSQAKVLISPSPIVSPELTPSPTVQPLAVQSPVSFSPTPIIAGEETQAVASPEPEISLMPSPSLEITPTLSPEVSAEPIFAGLTKDSNLPQTPQLTQDLLGLAINPNPILFSLAGYLGLVLAMGMFSKIYTPYPKAIIGAALAIVIVVAIAYLPGAEQTFYLTAKIL
ncbi:MAG: CAP domain-containing protein [Patescibacteria group bacterium]